MVVDGGGVVGSEEVKWVYTKALSNQGKKKEGTF
jgi:hypothetical protein